MIKQLKKLEQKDIIVIIVVFITLLALNIPLMFYIKSIGYQDSKETMSLKLRKTSEEIEDNIFSRVQNSIQPLSKDIHIKALFRQQTQDGNIAKETLEKVDLLMNNTKEILNANTVYLMDDTGTVIAGTKYGNTEETFVGNNYSFRPYFKQALKGINYVYGAVGKTSKQRGFYFSSPVRNGNKIMGVVVIKVDLKELDNILQEFDSKVTLLSPQKIIFASNSPEYLYKIFKPNESETTVTEQLKRQFGIEDSALLSADYMEDKIRLSGQEHLFEEVNLNIAGWSLAAFKPRKSFFYDLGSRQLFCIVFAVILLLAIIIELLLINQFYRIKLEEDLRKFSKTVEQSPLSVIITDLEGTIEYVNQTFEKITGYQAQEVIGENPNLLKTDAHSDNFYQELWDTITNGSTWEGEFYNQKKNGETYWETAKITPLIDKTGKIEAFIGIKEDITEEKHLKEKLEFFAERDELTNLYNRRIGTKLIKEHKREADKTKGCFSLAFIDINNLKLVNDVYGHESGDELIITVVNTIKENIRSSDLIARFGGDEFVIIFENARIDNAKKKLKTIQKQFHQMSETEDYNYQISISYGVEEYSRDKDISVDELISMADGKMYKFKQKYKEEHDLPIR